MIMEIEKQITFTLKYELIKSSDEDQGCWVMSAYNEQGDYIGGLDIVKNFVEDKGIIPERFKDYPEANSGRNATCSIGKSVKDGKWYGWSHRAIYGFKIGDKIDTDDHLCTKNGYIDEYINEHPEADYSLPVGFEAKTEEDCKRMAIAFADAVS